MAKRKSLAKEKFPSGISKMSGEMLGHLI